MVSFPNPLKGVFDYIANGIKDIFRWVLEKTLVRMAEGLRDDIVLPLMERAIKYMLRTPWPDNFDRFGAPTNGYWEPLYKEIYQAEIIVMLPAMFALALGATIFSNLTSDKQKRLKFTKRLFFVLPLLYSWWWFGGWFLHLTEQITIFFLGDSPLSFVESMESWLAFGGIAAIGALIVYIFALGLIGIVVGVFFIRFILLHVYMLAMPLLLCAWSIPVAGIDSFAWSMIRKFFPLALVPIPIAFLFEIATPLVNGVSDGLLQGILAVSTLGLSLYIPLSLFSFTSQVSRSLRSGKQAAKAGAAGVRAGMGGTDPTESKRGKPTGSTGLDNDDKQGAQADLSEGEGDGTKTTGSGEQNIPGSGGKSDRLARKGKTDFSPRQVSKRKTRARRSFGLAKGATSLASSATSKAAGGIKGGTKRAGVSAYRNHLQSDSGAETVGGMAKDMGEAAKDATVGKAAEKARSGLESASNFKRNQEQSLKAAKKEFEQKHDPDYTFDEDEVGETDPATDDVPPHKKDFAPRTGGVGPDSGETKETPGGFGTADVEDSNQANPSEGRRVGDVSGRGPESPDVDGESDDQFQMTNNSREVMGAYDNAGADSGEQTQAGSSDPSYDSESDTSQF